MADVRTFTVDFDEIRNRAKSVSEIKLNKNTTPNEVLVETLSILKISTLECQLALLALTVEQQRRDQEMADAGYGDGDVVGSAAIDRQKETFTEYEESFTRRIAAVERLIESRNEDQD